MSDVEYEKILQWAFKLLARRAYSTAKLRERLLKSYPEKSVAIERVLTRLTELGYLNDIDYARSYARNRLSVKPLGRARLQRTLTTAKKISSDQTQKALNEVFEEHQESDLCATAIEKFVRIHGRPEDIKASKKLVSYLIRLGFPYDLVMSQVRALSKRSFDEDLDEE